MFDADIVPAALRSRKQWVCWRRDESEHKIPINVATGYRASTTNPKTWATFDTALRAHSADGGLDGIGFVFTEADPFCGVDLDDCIGGDGKLEPWSAEVVELFSATYIERSPSGNGVKIFLIGRKPEGPCQSGQVECYSAKRFFAVTGEHWPGAGTGVTDCQASLDWFCGKYLAPKDPHSPTPILASAGSESSAGSDFSAGSVTVERIIEATLPKRIHERNACILRLARGLRFDAGLANLPLPKIKAIVREWHRRALPNIDTQPFDESWAEFVRAWGRARVPLFADVLRTVFAAAETQPVPEADDYDTLAIRKLIGACRQLAGPTGRFFLSTHAAAPHLGVPPMTVHRWLAMLVADGLLEVVRKGNAHQATRFQWREKALDKGADDST